MKKASTLGHQVAPGMVKPSSLGFLDVSMGAAAAGRSATAVAFTADAGRLTLRGAPAQDKRRVRPFERYRHGRALSKGGSNLRRCGETDSYRGSPLQQP